MAIAIRTMIIATATNVPATLPGLAQKPVFASCFCVTTVCTAAGGALGVIVKVLITPVTVITDVTGVGDQVEVDEDEVELEVVAAIGVGVGVGVVDVVGVVVEGLSGIVTGIYDGDGVDGVDGICRIIISMMPQLLPML